MLTVRFYEEPFESFFKKNTTFRGDIFLGWLNLTDFYIFYQGVFSIIIIILNL